MVEKKRGYFICDNSLPDTINKLVDAVNELQERLQIIEGLQGVETKDTLTRTSTH
jgi:hypothetical protein